MPDGVSGDWETMLSRACIFLTIGRQLAKATTTAADHVPDGTPEERSQNRSAPRGHLPDSESCHSATRRDWRIPHAGAGTRPLPTTARPSVWSDFKTGHGQFRHTFRRYRRAPEWSGAGTGDVPYQDPGSDHIRNRYANMSAALVMWIAMSCRPHLPGL